MRFETIPEDIPISKIALRIGKKIRENYDTERRRTLTLIDIISLFQYHIPAITPKDDNPLDVIQVDFLNNIFHLYTAGANINSGVPYQSNMLLRTVFETITKDMRLLALHEEGSLDYERMYKWITAKDPFGRDPERNEWGNNRTRNYLFEGEVLTSVRDLYARLSKLVHGSSRAVRFNISPPDEMIESTWNNIYWLALNSLLVLFYAFRNHLPLNQKYQGYLKEILSTYFLPRDVLFSHKLENMSFVWFENNL